MSKCQCNHCQCNAAKPSLPKNMTDTEKYTRKFEQQTVTRFYILTINIIDRDKNIFTVTDENGNEVDINWVTDIWCKAKHVETIEKKDDLIVLKYW